MSTRYLITGGNRGIGKGLVGKLLNRPQTTVITLVRDPAHVTSQSLSSLPKADGSKLIVEQYDAGSNDSALRAISAIVSKHNIHALDVVQTAHWPRNTAQSLASSLQTLSRTFSSIQLHQSYSSKPPCHFSRNPPVRNSSPSPHTQHRSV